MEHDETVDSTWKVVKESFVSSFKEMLRRWKWIRHTLGKPFSNITRKALFWNPSERGKVQPVNLWRQDPEADIDWG